jgi:hypothetical protein
MQFQAVIIESWEHFLRLSAFAFQVHKAIRAAPAGNANVEAFACANRVIPGVRQRIAVLQRLKPISRCRLKQQLHRLGCITFPCGGPSPKPDNVLRSFLRFEFVCVHRFLQYWPNPSFQPTAFVGG